MQKRLPILAIIAIALAVPAWSQAPSDPVYARLGLWDVERAGRADFEASAVRHIKPVLDRLFDDGVILEFGMDAADLHQEDNFSHELWFSASSLANLAHATDALGAMEKGLSDSDRARMMGSVTRHEDSQVVSLIFRSRTASISGGFSSSTSETLKPGQGQAYQQWFATNIQPVYEELMEQGAVTAFGMDADQIHSGSVNNRTVWQILPNAESLDIVEGAFREAFPPDKMAQLLGRWSEIVDTEAHRDSTSRVLFYRVR